MRQLHSLFAIVAASALGACAASAPTTPPPSRSSGDACGASAAQHAVGTPPAEAEPILRQASEAAGGTYRIVRHDQPITMEFNARRLTARVGRDGRIETVACG